MEEVRIAFTGSILKKAISDKLSSAEVWVFIDFHPDDYVSDPSFPIDPPDPSQTKLDWFLLPASYHNGGCGLGFADGHVQIKHWVSAATKQPVIYGNGVVEAAAINKTSSDTRDFKWLSEHSTELRH
ncbi:MAG: H-X9-DG-CTERM domain-containing protein [Limisphaerales bacterium]